MYFHFHAPTHHFDAPMKTVRCAFTKSNGTKCKRKIVIGTPYCFSHRQIEEHVCIKDSTIPNSGKGLFVCDRTAGANDIIFRNGDEICRYDGEVISAQENTRRYGVFTGVYSADLYNGDIEDASLRRGLGSTCNHTDDKNKVNAGLYPSEDGDRIVIMAKKNIRNNTEILLNYGKDYKFDEPTQYSTNRKKSTL